MSDRITLIYTGKTGLPGAGVSAGQFAALKTGYRFTKAIAQDNADTVSMTSSTTYADAFTYSLVLPSGTWTVEAYGELDLYNNDGPYADVRVLIAGNQGTVTNVILGGSRPSKSVRASHVLAGQTGTHTVRLQYKRATGSTGTLLATNPAFVIACTRTDT